MSHSVQLVSEVHNLKHSVWRYAVSVWKSRYESGARNKAVGSHPSPIPGAIDASVSAQLGGFCLLQACIHDLDLFFSANIAGRGIVIKLNSIMLLPLLKSLGNSSHTSGFPGGSLSKVSAFSVGDPRLIPGLGRSLGEGNGNPPQYSCLENPMDGGAWWATVHRVAKSQTRLSDFTFSFSRALL